MTVQELMCELADMIPDYGDHPDDYDELMDAIVEQARPHWITDRDPYPYECKRNDGSGFILCISGKDGNITYDHATMMTDNYYEDGEWYIGGVHRDGIHVHGWMEAPLWLDGDDDPEEDDRR